MTEAIDLSGKLSSAINGAYERGHPIIVGYVDESGRPSISFRGSVLVLSATEIGLWARKTDSGLAKAIETNPNLALLFFGDLPDGSRMRAALDGRAYADSSRNAQVYDGMGEVERGHDPEAKGVAVVVRIDKIAGMTVDGPFEQSSLA